MKASCGQHTDKTLICASNTAVFGDNGKHSEIDEDATVSSALPELYLVF
jgi:hypothetical protein